MLGEETLASDPRGSALTATERALAVLWQEVLQTPELPAASDDFFALGGDSMTMVMAEFRIMEEFPVQLPAGSILGAPTLRELATMVDAERCSTAVADAPSS